jgi:uncharacterized protein (TIGR02145 family)
MKTIITIITALLYVSSIAVAQDMVFIYKTVSDTFTCGNTLTDLRDGKTYNTVLIGTQCWMAQNLNYSDSGVFTPLATGQGAVGTQKYCYNDSESYCNTYGGLYEWAEIMNGAATCNGIDSLQPACTIPVQGICPCGWHIPSYYEWTLLEKNAGSSPASFPYDTATYGWLGINEGGNLKEIGSTHWLNPNNATNTSGFTALGAGNSYAGLFEHFREFSDYWTSTEYYDNVHPNNHSGAWNIHLDYFYATLHRFHHDKTHGFGVRCVKDTLYNTGIKENINEYHLTVFPNPSSFEITIKTNNKSEKLNYTIINPFGQIVQSGYVINGSVKVSIANLSAGMYFIQTLGQKSQTIKILKY